MKKISTLLLGMALTLPAYAITTDDIAGIYELQNPYGSTWYVAENGQTTFGCSEGDTEANADLIDHITITTDGENVYFSNFLGLTFYGELDLDAATISIPAQYVSATTGYSFLQCLYESTMFPADAPTFDENEAQPIVLQITEDGDLSLGNDYIAYWGWGANYGYITGTFHKTAGFEPDAAVDGLLGIHTCTEFEGWWNYIWTSDSEDDNWYEFNIATGVGIDEIGVDPGKFEVSILSVGGLDVQVNGLWWGALSITGSYDAATSTITFPLQSVWGGYTLCNSSLCDVEVPTEADVVPATAVVNADGSITFNYTVEYYNYPYLYATQVLDGEWNSVQSVADDNINAPVEYYNIQGMRVANPTPGSIYIQRQGSKAAKLLFR